MSRPDLTARPATVVGAFERLRGITEFGYTFLDNSGVPKKVPFAEMWRIAEARGAVALRARHAHVRFGPQLRREKSRAANSQQILHRTKRDAKPLWGLNKAQSEWARASRKRVSPRRSR